MSLRIYLFAEDTNKYRLACYIFWQMEIYCKIKNISFIEKESFLNVLAHLWRGISWYTIFVPWRFLEVLVSARFHSYHYLEKWWNLCSLLHIDLYEPWFLEVLVNARFHLYHFLEKWWNVCSLLHIELYEPWPTRE